MADEHLPIALRRTRRSNVGVGASADSSAAASLPSTARTPRRTNKGVRFSDPGPLLATGLTPMVRRTSLLNTPKRRRVSTPGKTAGHGNAWQDCASLPSAPATQNSLHQTLDGRIERRLRRNNLRDMISKIEQNKRAQSKASQAEITRLRAELKARDREIYELQNATLVVDTDRIWDLEQQVDDLKDELERQNAARNADQTRNSYNWTLAAKDPFSEDDFMDMTPDEEVFGETTMAQLACSTPSRARSSFPTPPATSPTLPTTPRHVSRPTVAVTKTPATQAVGVQAEFVDPEKLQLQDELTSLQREMEKLSNTLEGYKSLSERLSKQFASAVSDPVESEYSSSTDALERRAGVLLQAMGDRQAALSQLNTSITELGFPGEDASAMIMSLTSGFRAARLELEYLTPGEISLPLTSHGAEVLDLLLNRLRDLATRVKEGEDSIDEYHELEQSLRKQLDTRVTVMDGLKAEMGKAQKIMDDKNSRIKELEVGNDRLKGAVDGYVRDISELEKLIERLEQEGRDAGATHDAQKESSRRALVNKENTIAELEVQLAVALKRAESLKKNMEEMQAEKNKHIHALNKQQGAALALRDARVTELRGEIERINESLRSAHETICSLRVENGGLRTKMEEEKQRAKEAIDAMKEELQRALQVSQEFLNTPGKKNGSASDGSQQAATSGASPVVVQKGGFLAGNLARRASGKGQRRRYDSGMGLLDEDEVDF
ncbi:hypothetical protein HJFPF1_12566 [Paramyrothecium foliicola]|nr:hypothetical protein HJFPF1_12566 [Paramyrothecium foliicola]